MTGSDKHSALARWLLRMIPHLPLLYYLLSVFSLAVVGFDFVTAAGFPTWLAVTGAVAFGWIAGTSAPTSITISVTKSARRKRSQGD